LEKKKKIYQCNSYLIKVELQHW